MEEFTELEKNKLGGFKEHLSSVRMNITAATEELQSKFKEIGELKVQQKVLEEQNKKLLSEYKTILKDIENDRKILQNDINIYETDKNKLESDRLRFNTEISIELKDIELARNKTNDGIEEARSLIEKLNKEAKQVEKSIDELKSNRVTALELLNSTIRSINERSEELNSINNTYEENKKEINKKVKELEKQAEDSKKTADDESARKVAALADLSDIENRIDLKRKQMDVIYNRTKKAFALMYPGQNLDNII